MLDAGRKKKTLKSAGGKKRVPSQVFIADGKALLCKELNS